MRKLVIPGMLCGAALFLWLIRPEKVAPAGGMSPPSQSQSQPEAVEVADSGRIVVQIRPVISTAPEQFDPEAQSESRFPLHVRKQQ